MVALENGELGPLLSPGTLRGLEDECVTDVKVPRTWCWRSGSGRQSVEREGLHWAWGASPLPLSLFPAPFSLYGLLSFVQKREIKPILINSVSCSVYLKHLAGQ